jgi:hypothetical protein
MEPDDVRRDGGRFPKLRRRFAMAARRDEVMPHWPQTTPASTIAFALARSDSSEPMERSSG